MTSIEDTTYRPDQAGNVGTMGSIAGCNDLPAGGPKYRSMKMKKMKKTKKTGMTDDNIYSVLFGDDENELLPYMASDSFFEDLETLSKTKLREKYPHEFNCHRNMKLRCKKDNGYVLHPDLKDFRSLLRFKGPCPDPTYTLDRIDSSNPEYAPHTVQWASKSQQTHNRINTRYHTDLSGTRLSVSEWSRRSDIPGKTIHRRIADGWSVDEAVTTRVGEPRNLVVSSKSHVSNGYGDEYLDLWERILSDNYHQPVFTPSKAEKGVLKAIVSTFINGAVPPIDVLEGVLVEWHAFCEFTNKHYGVAWQEQPEVPTIAYLSRNLIAAANFWATIGKKKQEQRREELLVQALEKSSHEFGCLNKLSDPYFSELVEEIKESEAKGDDSSVLYNSLMHYLETFDYATEHAEWERTNERELILTMTSVELKDYQSQSGPSEAQGPSIIMRRLDRW